MHILLVKLQLRIPLARSLKDKRQQIKSLKDRISHRFNASIAETGSLDNWQKAELGICIISNDRSHLDKQYNLIETVVLEYPELEIIQVSREWL